MKKILKTVAVAGFSAWMLLSASVLPGSAAEGICKEGGMFRKQMHHHVGYNASIHQQEYLSYLVKEYAPETKKDWEKAFTERNAVLDQMKAKMDSMDKEELKAKFKEKHGKMNRQGLKSKMGDPVDREKMKAEMETKRNLENNFAQAVKNHDRKAIKELMPKMLDDYKKCTERMSQRFEKMKEQFDSLSSKK